MKIIDTDHRALLDQALKGTSRDLDFMARKYDATLLEAERSLIDDAANESAAAERALADFYDEGATKESPSDAAKAQLGWALVAGAMGVMVGLFFGVRSWSFPGIEKLPGLLRDPVKLALMLGIPAGLAAAHVGHATAGISSAKNLPDILDRGEKTVTVGYVALAVSVLVFGLTRAIGKLPDEIELCALLGVELAFAAVAAGHLIQRCAHREVEAKFQRAKRAADVAIELLTILNALNIDPSPRGPESMAAATAIPEDDDRNPPTGAAKRTQRAAPAAKMGAQTPSLSRNGDDDTLPRGRASRWTDRVPVIVTALLLAGVARAQAQAISVGWYEDVTHSCLSADLVAANRVGADALPKALQAIQSRVIVGMYRVTGEPESSRAPVSSFTLAPLALDSCTSYSAVKCAHERDEAIARWQRERAPVLARLAAAIDTAASALPGAAGGRGRTCLGSVFADAGGDDWSVIVTDANPQRCPQEIPAAARPGHQLVVVVASRSDGVLMQVRIAERVLLLRRKGYLALDSKRLSSFDWEAFIAGRLR